MLCKCFGCCFRKYFCAATQRIFFLKHKICSATRKTNIFIKLPNGFFRELFFLHKFVKKVCFQKPKIVKYKIHKEVKIKTHYFETKLKTKRFFNHLFQKNIFRKRGFQKMENCFLKYFKTKQNKKYVDTTTKIIFANSFFENDSFGKKRFTKILSRQQKY